MWQGVRTKIERRRKRSWILKLTDVCLNSTFNFSSDLYKCDHSVQFYFKYLFTIAIALCKLAANFLKLKIGTN